MSNETIIEQRPVPGVVVLALNRPEKRNALSLELMSSLAEKCESLARSGERVVIFRGEGPSFCAGLDLAEANDSSKSELCARAVVRMLRAVYDLPQVSIACIHGAAVAGGAGLMTACDLGIVESGARIGYPEIKRGLVAASVMALLRRQIRERDARELLVMGDLISAERAFEMGLVNRVVPAGQALEESMHWARRALDGAPGAIAQTKKLLRDLWPSPLESDLDHTLQSYLTARGSSEAQEGIQAFLEKRPPSWSDHEKSMSKPKDAWVEGLTFGQVLSETVRRHGERDAVVFPQLNLRWNYRTFDEEVRKTARSLIALGLEPGDHVGIWATNWPEWILLQFATGLAGLVLVNVNPAYRTSELAYILDQADLKALFIGDRFKNSDYEAMVEEVIGGPPARGSKLELKEFPRLRHVVSIKKNPGRPWIEAWPKFLGRESAVSNDRLEALAEGTRPDQPVNIQYTSGTTGAPKGAMLSHRNLLLNAYHVGRRMHFTERDRLAIPVPFYHCFGCVMGTLMCAVYGAAMVVPAEYFDPEATLVAVEREKCTGLYGVPTMFNAELHHPRFSEFDLSSLRTGIMAGSPCPIELMKQVTSRMHLPEITIAYGLTEASPVITQTETTESLEVRVSTVGKALPGLEVRLVDPATLQDVKPGEQGELWVRGHGVMIGYYNKPEATEAAITKDQWLRSGDLATITPSGHYRITGRFKDMIIRGGENVYPREIEEFLLTHPAIRDAQVVGVPDKHFGEQISAWIILKEPGSLTAEELKQFCKTRIAHYKVPFYIEFVDQFPLTVTGKIQKFKLREQAIDRYGLQSAARIETA